MSAHLVAHLVAIHGLKGSGKSTVARHLVAAHGFELVKFADPIKTMLRILMSERGAHDDIIERCIEGDLKEAPLASLDGKSARFAMQAMGDGMWQGKATPWAAMAAQRIEALLSSGRSVVVDDLRRDHEWNAIRHLGASAWCVERRERAVAQAPGAFEEFSAHGCHCCCRRHMPGDRQWDWIDARFMAEETWEMLCIELPGLSDRDMALRISEHFFQMLADPLPPGHDTARHVSESGLDLDWNLRIRNDDTEANLIRGVEALMPNALGMEKAA